MLTFNHVDGRSSALLAACPRPRALASLALTLPSACWRGVTAPSASVEAPAVAGGAAEPRPFALARSEFGYGLVAGEMSSRRAGFGFGAGATIAPDTRNQQDKHDLTNRREPRTWRPPH